MDSTQKIKIEGTAVSIALARGFLENGKTIFDAFMPLVLETIGILEDRVFTKDKLREAVVSRFGFDIPVPVLGTFLNKAKARGFIERNGGSYCRINNVDFGGAALATRHEELVSRISELCAELRSQAMAKGITLSSDDDEVIQIIVRVLELNRVGILLDTEDLSSFTSPLDSEGSIVATFLMEQLESKDSLFANTILELLEGTILVHALSVEGLDRLSSKLHGLQVFFDTGLILGLLGHQGEAQRKMVANVVTSLKKGGASCAVFRETLDEVDSILRIYETKLGTTADRMALKPTPVTRHFLKSCYSILDIADFRSLLEPDLKKLGLLIINNSEFDPAIRHDFDDLAESYSSPEAGPDSPRVQHDVNCIRAVMSLRKGRTANTFGRARALFCSTTFLVVTRGIDWYRRAGGAGVPPIIHYQSLSNLLWLRNPQLGRALKCSEMIARFKIALMPSQGIWISFVRYLQKLQGEGKLRDEEILLLLADGITERFLATVETQYLDKQVDPDAACFAEVIERVKVEILEEGRQKGLQESQSDLESSQSQTVHLEGLLKSESQLRVEAEASLKTEKRNRIALAKRIAKVLARGIVGALCLAWTALVVYSFFQQTQGTNWPRVVGVTGAILQLVAWLTDILNPRLLAAYLEQRIITFLRRDETE